MRNSFEGIIKDYGELAKEQANEELTPHEERELESAATYRMRRAVKQRNSKLSAQERIFALQAQK